MPRSAVILVMLVAMLWQSVALARVGSSVNTFADLAHTALHWQDKAHHHHDDGSYHLDDSSESVHHLICDHLCATVALLVSTSPAIPILGSTAPGAPQKAPVPDPDPEGLLRPPRSRA